MAANSDRVTEYYSGPYQPNQQVDYQHRIANALEYIAYAMGDIRASLKEIDFREKAKFELELSRQKIPR